MNRSKYIASLLCAGMLIVLAACSSTGTARELQDAPIPADPLVRTGLLANGLRYYLRENGKPAGRVYLSLFVKTGSAMETDNEKGVAHFTEHMAFNGTDHFPKADLVDYLRSLGMRFGPEVNAYTSFDRTVYGIEVPSLERKIPDKALQVLDDWMRGLSFDAAEVEAERSVILEEHRQGLGAMDRIRRELLPVLLGGSVYADRLPIGDPEIVKAVSPETLSGFYHRWYRPERMAISIVGDFDAETLEKELSSRFGTAFHNGDPKPLPDMELPAPVQGQIKYLALDDSELSHGFVSLYYKLPPRKPASSVSGYRQDIIENLISQVANERFEAAAAKSAAPFAGAGMGMQRYGAASRFLVWSAIPEKGSTTDTLRSVLEEREALLRYGITTAEFDRACENLTSSLAQAWAEREHQESQSIVDGLSAFYLDGAAMPSIGWEFETVKTVLPGISLAEVNQEIRSLLSLQDLTLTLIAPSAEKSSLPSREDCLEIAKEVSASKVEAPSAEDLGPALDGDIPAAGTISTEHREGSPEALVCDLANGARVMLVPTDNKADEVVMYALAREGEAAVADAAAVSASLASQLGAASGLGPYSVAQLSKLLAGKQLSLSFFSSMHYHGLQGQTSVKDAEMFFQLLRKTLTTPRIDPDAAQAELDYLKTTLSQKDENPDTVFSDSIRREVTSGHSRFLPLDLARLGQLDLDKAASYLSDSMKVGDYTFVFVGNIDLKEWRALVSTYIASIPGKRIDRPWVNLGVVRPGNKDVTIRKGKENQAKVFLSWFSPFPWGEHAEAAADLLNEYLDIRLTEKIREELGGVYSPQVSVSLQTVPADELSLYVQFSCDPNRVAELSNAIEAEIGKIAKQEINGDSFKKAREALIKSSAISLEQNSYIAWEYASLNVITKQPLEELAHRNQYLESVTPSDVSGLCATLVKSGRLRLQLLPEALP